MNRTFNKAPMPTIPAKIQTSLACAIDASRTAALMMGWARFAVKAVLGVALLALVPTSAQAQTLTTVTGTVTDPGGLPYSGARLSISLVSPGGRSPELTPCASPAAGCQIQNPGSVTLDSNGSLPGGGINLWANASILPAGTTYSFTVTLSPGFPPPWGTGPQTFTVTGVTIAGATQDLSATLSAAALSLSRVSAAGAFLVTNFNNRTVAASTTEFWPAGGGFPSTAEANAQVPVPVACVATNLRVRSLTAQSGTGNFAITLRRNGASTPIVVTVAAGAASGTYSDLVHTISLSAGDLIDYQAANSATVSSATVSLVSLQCH